MFSPRVLTPKFTSIMPNPDVILDRTPRSDILYQVRHPYFWVPFSRRCQGGGAATRLTADQLNSGSNPDLGFGRGSKEALPGEDRRSRSSTRAGVRKDGCPGNSSSSVVIAAIAVGKHLDPFRTQQLSRLTWYAVLRYASPREPYLAAITFLTRYLFYWKSY